MKNPCAKPFPTFTHRIVRGESPIGSLLDTSRGVVTATRYFPASKELDFKKDISFGRLVGELTELISMLQLTSLFLCKLDDIWRNNLCVEVFEAEEGCGLKSCHSKVRKMFRADVTDKNIGFQIDSLK